MSKRPKAIARKATRRPRPGGAGVSRRAANVPERTPERGQQGALFKATAAERKQSEKILRDAARHQSRIKQLTKTLKRETRAADTALVGLYHFLKVHPSIADDLQQRELFEQERADREREAKDLVGRDVPEHVPV